MSIKIKVKPRIKNQDSENDVKANKRRQQHEDHHRPSVFLSWHDLEFKVKVFANASQKITPVDDDTSEISQPKKTFNPLEMIKSRIHKVDKQVLHPLSG